VKCVGMCQPSGFHGKAVSTLKSIVTRYPSELHIWNDLGVKCLLAGLQDEARKAFTEVGTLLTLSSDIH